jgi:shikimate dehydrogenase
VLHRAAYAALGLDWAYHAIECDEAALPGVLVERADWAGFSCTMPLKHATLSVAGEVAPLAAAVGAANTLLPVAAGWRAENTDVTGIASTLSEAGVTGGRATVLGAGGTAQAAVVALAELRVERCSVLVRDPSRAGPVVWTAEQVGMEVAVGTLRPDADELDADIVVSALPPRGADAVAGRRWTAEQTVLDVVYDPWPTRLAAGAAAAGGRVLSGALVLLYQAAAQVELMTGQPAPVAEMRAALRAAAPTSDV